MITEGFCSRLDPSASQSGLVWRWCAVNLIMFGRRMPRPGPEGQPVPRNTKA